MATRFQWINDLDAPLDTVLNFWYTAYADRPPAISYEELRDTGRIDDWLRRNMALVVNGYVSHVPNVSYQSPSSTMKSCRMYDHPEYHIGIYHDTYYKDVHIVLTLKEKHGNNR